MGGTSQKPQDMHGEAALLLDILDLLLHTAAVSSTAAATGSMAAPDSDQMILDGQGSSGPDQQQLACPHQKRSDKPNLARQPVLQTVGYGDSVLWGLRAVAALAKQDTLAPFCAQMLTEYVLERFVLLSRDWPVEVGQAAAEVSMNRPS